MECSLFHSLMRCLIEEPIHPEIAFFSSLSPQVFEGASDLGLNLCAQSVFLNPMAWMRAEVKQTLSGKLYCPNCQARVGHYSWVAGGSCAPGCGVAVAPAFQLDVTEIIFKTRNKYLQSSGREPVVV